MKDKDIRRLAILAVVAVLVVIAMAFAGLFSVVGLQGNFITFTNNPTKPAFSPTENPSFTITTSEFSGTSHSNYCTQYGAYVYITDIFVDGKDLGINPLAPCKDLWGTLTGGQCASFSNCDISGNPGTTLCPGYCNSVLAPRPFEQKVTTSAQTILSYSLPADKFALLSPLSPGQHTIKVVGYIAGSCTPPNTKGWTCESAAYQGKAAEWDDTFNVTGEITTLPITPPVTAQPPPTQTVTIPAIITENGTTTVQTPVGNVSGNSMLFAGAIVAVVALLLILAFSEGWIFKKKGR